MRVNLKLITSTLIFITFLNSGCSQAPQKEKAMGINVILSFKIRPDKVESFTSLMKTVKVTLPSVPGCQTVKVYRSPNDPLLFTLVETWDSKEIHAKHIQGLKDSGQWDAIAEYFTADPVSNYYEEL